MQAPCSRPSLSALPSISVPIITQLHRAFHARKQEKLELSRLKMLTAAFEIYKQKWDDLLSKAEEQDCIYEPATPFLTFREFPWPLINCTDEAELWPLTSSVKLDIYHFLTMWHIPELHREVTFNFHVWVVLDFPTRFLDFVRDEDRYHVFNVAMEVKKLMSNHGTLGGELEERERVRERGRWEEKNAKRMPHARWRRKFNESRVALKRSFTK